MKPRRALVLLLVLPLVGCGGGGGTPASQPSSDNKPRAGSHCPDLAPLGKQARFTDSAGASVAALELGTGKTGVVLAHQNESDLCEWLPYGKQLMERGYHVLAFDFPGEGASDPRTTNTGLDQDVVAAATYLRGKGATTLVLMGASKGGTASLVAATEIQPPVAAVVSLSAPLAFAGTSAGTAVQSLTVPVLFLATEADTDFADSAKVLYDATPAATEKQIFIGIGGQHGVGVLGSPEADKVKASIDKLLAAHAPPAQ
jgi:dienelactone hydrolase